jgi:hypothetical protein
MSAVVQFQRGPGRRDAFQGKFSEGCRPKEPEGSSDFLLGSVATSDRAQEAAFAAPASEISR